MKRPLLLLLALAALIVAVIFLFPNEEGAPLEPLTEPPVERVDEPPRSLAEIEAQTEQLREFAASLGGDLQSGALRAEMVATGAASLRAVEEPTCSQHDLILSKGVMLHELLEGVKIV